MLREVEAEIARLQQVAELLRGGTSASPKPRKQRKKRAPMSQAARDKIAAAQRKRWAKQKKAE
jgi:hypothetical protein